MSAVDGCLLKIRTAWVQCEWAQPIRDGLWLVEERLRSAVESDIGLLGELSGRLFAAGGKRVRPALVLLSCYAVGESHIEVRPTDLAVATELVHAASIVHDDVIDEASNRRGVPTAASIWGNKLSVLGGDFLLARAFAILSAYEGCGVLSVLSRVASNMAESEVLQAQCEFSFDSWEQNYDHIIQGKTASLMMACCECGAIIAGADEKTKSALAGFGAEFGLAFQISDDLLDIVGDPSDTGKDVGSDIVAGKYTLPVVIAAQMDKLVRNAVESADQNGWTTHDREMVVRMVRDSGAVDKARSVALGHVANATVHLANLPDSEYRLALDALADQVVDRVS